MASAFIRRRLGKASDTGARPVIGFEVEWTAANDKRRRKLHPTLAAAKAHRDVLNAPKAASELAPLGAETVEMAARDWVARVRANGRARSTWRKYEQHAERHIFPIMVIIREGTEPKPFGSLKIAEITTPVVLRFKAALQKAGRSPSMVARILGDVRMLFGDAQLAGIVRENVARPVRAQRGERHRARIEIPDPGQVRLLLAALEAPNGPLTLGQVWVPLLAGTGMRPGETRALMWDEVITEGSPFIKVVRAADEQGQIGPPKSQAGHRDIPISEQLAELLLAWKGVCPKSPKFAEHGGLVFSTSAGHVQSHSNLLNRIWHPLMRICGLVRPTRKRDAEGKPIVTPLFTPYALRHFFASYLIEIRGKNPKQVQRLMGHENIELTLQVYGHLWRDAQDDNAVAEALGRFLKPTDVERAKFARLTSERLH